MAESEPIEVVVKAGSPGETGDVIVKQEPGVSTPSLSQNEPAGRAGLPERPRSRSPTERNDTYGDRRRERPTRPPPGPRGRRKPPLSFAGRGTPARPGRLSPGPPPMPPPGPPPTGYRRPDRLDSPPPPHRRGRSPEPLRRRSPPILPPIPPPLPPPPSYGRSRYNSPPRRSPPPGRRWGGPRSRSPPPRGYRSPPGSRRRRSPMRSPPPRRRSPPPGTYRRSSRSPPYKRRGASPYSPRRPSPSRRSPPRTGARTRSISPQPIKHRLPSPGRSIVRSRILPARSSTNSRRGSPSGTKEQSPSGYRSPRKRTRSPGKEDTIIKEEDDHISKKRRTLDGVPNQDPKADSPMQGIRKEPEDQPMSFAKPDRASETRLPTEPRSFRDARDARDSNQNAAVLRVKTEPQDVEMVDGTAAVSTPALATPATPALWKALNVPNASNHSAQPSYGTAGSPVPPQSNQPPPTPTIAVPKMPSWKKDTITPELDAEIERIRAIRLNMAAEHNNITTAVRRALYELELVDFDLRASEARLVVAEKQSERAAKGMPIYIEESAGP